MIDLIVPTVPGREESLERCLASFPDLNHIVVTGQPTCGLGWIEGIKRSSADYLLLCCDDIEADPKCDLSAAIEATNDGYLPAPVIHRPNGTLESAGGDMGRPACLISEVQPDWTPVDFTPMPFGTREQVRKIRMIGAHYLTDTYWSHKGRQLGYETVLRHDFRLIHHHHSVGRKEPGPDDTRLYREGMNA